MEIGASAHRRGKWRLGGPVALGLACALAGLAGCTDTHTLQWDPLTVNGRDGSAPALPLESVMRIAAAARAGGDYGNAVNLYRHAATMAPHDPAPLVALGDTLIDMGRVDEAIVNYNAALNIGPHDAEALRGLARAYLKTGRPDLAGAPLAVAYQDTPNDPKLLLLIGVADDFLGQHADAQGRYQAGLVIAPGDRSLSLDLALSLALSERFDEAIAILRPFAYGAESTPQDRQTLALIYGIKGDSTLARELARMDLDPSSADHNLAFYESLRRLSPDARSRAILSASAAQRTTPQF
jgi:Flp pilus assembly protein TadD